MAASERKPVDVLAVMGNAAYVLTERHPSYKSPTAESLTEARAAVADLIGAAKGVSEMEHEPRFLYGEIESLRAALARCGAQP